MATATTPDIPTRQRIVTAAIELFSEQGFKGTTVGEIEAAAGLVPRSGGLYKHFASKEAVIEAALEAHDREIDAVVASLGALPLGDLRAEMTLVARLVLSSLESERRLARIIMKEGARFPALRDSFYERVVERGAGLAEGLLVQICARAGVDPPADRAPAVMLLASLVGYRLQDFMFDRLPNDVSEEDFVAAWVQGAIALFASWGIDPAPTTGGPPR